MIWLNTIRALISLVAQKGWFLHQLDVKSAILNGVLQEESLCMETEGFVAKGEEEKMFFFFLEALSVLKQVPQAWHSEIDG